MRRLPAAAGAALLAAALAGPALSDDQPAATTAGAFQRALPDAALAAQRGGAAAEEAPEVWNSITINGRADNISVNNAITGDNIVGGGSFSGSSGFPTVIQNSGNGVLIQNATIINVTVKP
jgi:hypothetical protein